MNQSFMKEKPVFPLLTSMALPMVISMLVNSLYNIIDSFFVAQISEQAMTALSLVYPVQNLINAIAIGFGVGMNALIALCLGAGDVKNANRAATHGMLFSVVHGIVITVVSIGIMPFFLSLFTKDTEVLQLGTRYAYLPLLFNAARCNRQKTICNRRACHFKSGSAVPAGFFLKCTAGGIFTELCRCFGNLL